MPTTIINDMDHMLDINELHLNPGDQGQMKPQTPNIILYAAQDYKHAKGQFMDNTTYTASTNANAVRFLCNDPNKPVVYLKA